MINPNNLNEICFPHIVPGDTLGGIRYVWNNCNGGAKPIGAFGFTTNTFMGGQCLILGFIKELGIWGCQDKTNRGILRAFYLDDPDIITEYGKQMIQQALPTKTILYIKYDKLPKTKVDKDRLTKAQKDAEIEGIEPHIVSRASAETLESLIKARRYEKQQEELAKPIIPPVVEESKPVVPKKPRAVSPKVTTGEVVAKIKI
jgi:hypothetical protein